MKQWDDLSEIYQAVWLKLEQAARDRHEAWHLVTVGTVRNAFPEMRTVVLRGASQEKNLCWFHTDLRSPKVQDMEQSSYGSLLFYDPKPKWQLRLRGKFFLDSQSKATEAIWQKTTPSAKRCFQGPFSPGSPSQKYSSNLPTEELGPEAGRENFSRLLFSISEMDWLYLRADGHQRALWKLGSSQKEVGTWLNP